MLHAAGVVGTNDRMEKLMWDINAHATEAILTRAVAADYVTKGIRCNAICPGTVDSPSLHERLKATGDYEAALKAFIARQAMGRLGHPEEIAALVCYLAADESGFTTGTEHVIDGGWTA